ncbi:MAG TPA: FtsH protease activity modulator HflK [Hydrogenophaga sp.]|uniref:FtsH protease activity modulator HflK n=1 Tax=Hydrogenophaga sp. TaxID=1904254 RepID=UPI002C2B4D15|nr:FtsH protease activity modulator HflK [Hydrogenophaga sp.]HMN91850.1 FtsH protease activity modulator HflK [Hydrogenophaga sp.]HMP09010.1 FtsH protease activity modulator HflK [Hydrogenophaga sp.]
MDVNYPSGNSETGRPPRHNGWRKVLGMFNLNDPRWGRGDDSGQGGDEPSGPDNNRQDERGPQRDQRPRGQGPNQGPPDLDELWRDFNRKLGGLLGNTRGGGRGGQGGSGGGMGGFTPNPKTAGIGVGLIAGVAGLIWLGTGFFIVQEGQQAVITQFGKYHSTVGAGFNWRFPFPIQRHETVFVTQLRSVDVGRDNIVPATGLRESSMLTQDENIVDIKFVVQYRLNDARAFLFETRDPDVAVLKAAETAVREVVGAMKMDAVLAEERDQIAPRVRNLMQVILDRYRVGIEVTGVNLQQGGVRPPEQVQAAFDDVLKASQERERAKNEAEAYANDVVPRARGTAARLVEEAEGYRARIVAQAEGDSQRFSSVLTEYQRAPVVTRERMYIDAMQEVYSNVTKVLVDSKSGSNLLYLPLDKIMQMAGQPATATGPAVPASPTPATSSTTPRAMDNAARSRERDSR